ncbi:B-cell antigen receptor complex-associated protein beta chain [Clupea harengus]|uniref:B-cell antigen receptor complex-associated protein beta chain n=1 Tax=Clupea harengus TaxID=7950 RepID=A0A6P8EYR6_CLUHA|nr:B-cell antigen receptor complex-associated protein beta chain [Clupea harengus]
MCRQMILFLFIILVGTSANELFQWPRFVGVKTGSRVTLSCVDKASGKGDKMQEVSWRKALSPGNPDHPLEQSKDVNFGQRTGRMTLSRMQTEHSGIYFCYINGTKGPGSEVQVHRPRDLVAAIRRSNMKDVVIFIQASLLGVFLLLPHFCYKQQQAKEEAVYEDPHDDHTYEGLDIEHVVLYEDIPAFSGWDADEPCVADEPCDMESPDQE